ncbi:hypothetical protein [Bacillus changyiensis]|nr:hypothetical protein [Bacillus changyiensis]MDA1476633.1 hypothetical protein [Bacillus changyiensis]
MTIEEMAKVTAHFSGVDLEQLMSDASDQAIERSLQQGELVTCYPN